MGSTAGTLITIASRTRKLFFGAGSDGDSEDIAEWGLEIVGQYNESEARIL